MQFTALQIAHIEGLFSLSMAATMKCSMAAASRAASRRAGKAQPRRAAARAAGITGIHAREVIDSRGNPTVEVVRVPPLDGSTCAHGRPRDDRAPPLATAARGAGKGREALLRLS